MVGHDFFLLGNDQPFFKGRKETLGEVLDLREGDLRFKLWIIEPPKTGHPPPVPRWLFCLPAGSFPKVWVKTHQPGTAGFSPWLHLPGFHFGYLFLTHSQVEFSLLSGVG